MDLYTSFPWPTLCEEVAKLRIELPSSGEEPGGGDADRACDNEEETIPSVPVAAVPAVPGHTAGHSLAKNSVIPA